MEGAQKVTFSVHKTFTRKCIFGAKCVQGDHLEGFEACLKRRSELRTRARNLFVFQRKVKDLHDNLYKMNCFLKEDQRFER